MQIYLIAEIGCNHQGNFDRAKELIKLARESGANCAKFQKRENRELFSIEEFLQMHPNQAHAFGKNYGEHREFLEFTIEQHAELKKYCDSLEIDYSASVWELTSAKKIASLNPKFIKIGSPTNFDLEIYKYLAENYNGDLHISLGMTYLAEVEKLYNFLFNDLKIKNKVVFYHCVSGYPIKISDSCMLEILRIRKKFGNCELGFSGHHTGTDLDVVALALGVKYIERHFTFDQNAKGTDHSTSLLPSEFANLRTKLDALSKCLRFKQQDVLLDCEYVQRLKLKKPSELIL